MLYWLARLTRIFAAWLDLLLFTTFMWLCAFLPASFRDRFYPRLYQRWNWCFVRAMNCQLFIHQHNSKPLPDSYLLIANHPSAFEDVAVPAAFPVRVLAKAEVADWFVVGRIGRAANSIFFKREELDARRAAAKIIEARLRAGEKIAVFPEGGCFGRRLAPKFHYGTFEMALNTNTPVVPAFIHYEAQEDFEWLNQTLPQKMWQIIRADNKRVNLHVFDPFDPADFSDKKAMTEHVYDCYLGWQKRFLE